MAKVPMTKIELVGLLADAQHIIERLQRRGVVELENISSPDLIKLETAASVATFGKNLAAAETALGILEEYGAPKKSLLASLYGRKLLSTEAFAEKKEKTAKTQELCYRIAELDREKKALEAEIGQNQLRRDQLLPWQNFPYGEAALSTESTVTLPGLLPRAWEENELSDVLSEAAGVPVEACVLSAVKGQSAVALTVLKEDREKLESTLREMEFAPAPLPRNRSAREEIASLGQAEKELREKRKNKKKALTDIAQNAREDVVFLADFLRMRMDKYRALEKLGMTDSAVFLRGYVPAKWAEKLAAEFEEKHGAYVVLSPVGPEDDEPVLLQNDAFAAPLESITEMYSLPGKRTRIPPPSWPSPTTSCSA